MASVSISSVSKRYGDFVAVRNLSLDIRDGEFLTLLGPSGCGKTTTLRMVAGLVIPDSGKIIIGDKDVTRTPPERRRIGMVFQDYALFPHLTIAENVAFGLRERKVPKAQRQTRVEEMLNLVRLADQKHKFPQQLSGGQRQRVALARALAFPPEVLLMDEPLGALDLKLRQTMQLELRRIQRELGITVIFVTHDQEEALNLSDRIAVMLHGSIVQLGPGPEIYNNPATPFVGDFLGRINFFKGLVRRRPCGSHFINWAGTDIDLTPDVRQGTTVCIGVRPEQMRLSKPGSFADLTAIKGRIEGVVFGGNVVRYYVACDHDARLLVEQPGCALFREGDAVEVAWDRQSVVIWPE